MPPVIASRDPELVETLRQCELCVPREFALERATDWGLLFHSPENPQSHDSNHALITRADCDVDAALGEIARFYSGVGLTPRVYPSHLINEKQVLQPALERHGYRFEPFGNPTRWMLLDDPRIDGASPLEIEVRRVHSIDPAVLALVHSEGQRPWGEGVLRRQLAHDGLFLFVGFVGEEAVSMALLSQVDTLARVDDVRTAPSHRCRGYNLAVLRHLLRFHLDTSHKPLYLVTDNPAAQRNYERCGFEDLRLPWEGWVATLPEPPVI